MTMVAGGGLKLALFAGLLITVVGGRLLPVMITLMPTSCRSMLRSEELVAAWWISTAMTLLPLSRRGRAEFTLVVSTVLSGGAGPTVSEAKVKLAGMFVVRKTSVPFR